MFLFFFFFQAEDGIRDFHVTGVQTCALPIYDLPGAVPEEVKEERWHRFMAAQQEISRDLLREKKGRTIDVLIDEVDEEGAIGRSPWDAPEIDGSVFLNGETRVKPGDIVRAKVVEADEYDLWAELICDEGERAA